MTYQEGFKHFIRVLIYFQLSKLKPGRFLCLPGNDFLLERQLALLNWRVVGYERNPNIHRIHEGTAFNFMKYLCADVYDAKGEYNAGFLDFFGSLNATNSKALDVRFSKGAKVVFTFRGSRERAAKPYIDMQNRLSSYLDVLSHKGFYTDTVYKYYRRLTTNGIHLMVFFTTYGIEREGIVPIYELNKKLE